MLRVEAAKVAGSLVLALTVEGSLPFLTTSTHTVEARLRRSRRDNFTDQSWWLAS